MKKVKVKFNIMDFLIVFTLILVVVSSVIQGIAVRRFENNNVVKTATLVLRTYDPNEVIVSKFKLNDNIYCDELLENEPIGKISESNESALSALPIVYTKSQGSNQGEYDITVEVQCLVSSEGFYSINGVVIAPGMNFKFNNGYIGFECKIVNIDIEG